MSDFNSLIEEDNNNLLDTDLQDIPECITTRLSIIERQLNHDEIQVNPEYEKINPVGRHWFGRQEIDEKYFESLKEFIATHGQRSPIVISQHNVILDGHKTFRALKELGISPVRCEVKTFEDEFDEQVFIVDSNLNPNLREFQKCELLIALDKIEKSRVLLRQDLRYMTHGIWHRNLLIGLEFGSGILSSILCCFCVVDNEEDPFERVAIEKKDRAHKWAEHMLSHLDDNSAFGGWSKYAPKLLSFPREIDPKTHDWRFIPIEDATEQIQKFISINRSKKVMALARHNKRVIQNGIQPAG